jgi:hypothetical protein
VPYFSYVGVALQPIRLDIEQNTIARLLRMLDTIGREWTLRERAHARLLEQRGAGGGSGGGGSGGSGSGGSGSGTGSSVSGPAVAPASAPSPSAASSDPLQPTSVHRQGSSGGAVVVVRGGKDEVLYEISGDEIDLADWSAVSAQVRKLKPPTPSPKLTLWPVVVGRLCTGRAERGAHP